MSQPPVLVIKNLTVAVPTEKGERVLVKNLSLEVPAGEIISLVGSSGSGKTTTGLAILRLLPEVFLIQSGQIFFNGEDLFLLNAEHMRGIRGKSISMVFQEPLYAFNPLLTIGAQIDEVMAAHGLSFRANIRSKTLELLDLVEISEPKRIAESFPHQLSGGMRQRAMIAQALAGQPKLVIADEPTSNLDVTIQANIMELFRKIKRELNLSILLITHDLGMVAHLADRVAVLANGKVVEYGPTRQVLESPNDPFTKKLMRAFAI